ncbi:cysteine-rich protein 2-binding protein-like [Gigantopelta aegis]|uniref:cysteine-rich protein 2-binding protein-like n=1 Tax=Gigantopelta aegis TaxID=1735272 RepID=UPI001B888B23|nr:cysteine-rich protein 2-binding protein-like [Gigantopelta aegis]XP_041356686.1 cysteine-rich protein 2-binding protein-like [Gigantopelta aegis]XP_041356688.1 cysteine-rich protein 2-binding protein-like [Gigantopelta aegis]
MKTSGQLEECYCGWVEPAQVPSTFVCSGCKKHFHPGCLLSGKPSPLEGDIFFKFTCTQCGEDEQEHFERIKLQWMQVVMLALYNLQLSSSGKFGYFRWKEHICAFIDKHWSLLFASHRKKTSLWYGTVAGTLSSGCPSYFESGAKKLKETGWWRLVEMKAPVLKPDVPRGVRKKAAFPLDTSAIKVEGLRSRRGKTSIQAAIELKAKRSTLLEAKEIRKAKSKASKLESASLKPDDTIIEPAESVSRPSTSVSETAECAEIKQEPQSEEDSFNLSTSNVLSTSVQSDKEIDHRLSLSSATIPEMLQMGDEALDSESEMEIDPGSMLDPQTALPSLPSSSFSIEDMLSTLDGTEQTVSESVEKTVETTNSVSVKEKLADSNDDQSEAESEDGQFEPPAAEDEQKNKKPDTSSTTQEDATAKPPSVKYVPMSLYEEHQLLKKLNAADRKTLLDPEVKRLQRKLAVRQIKRERGLPVFDLDAEVKRLTQPHWSTNQDRADEMKYLNSFGCPVSTYQASNMRILDRFQTGFRTVQVMSDRRVSFLNRLVGTEDDQLQSICSPYTTRVLKPFIRRDFESRPLKMKLLQEIQAYPHRKDPSWKNPALPPIDYCYVRPQHIPSVNVLCREFFWPGIDLSECLHYPDFSCVVLYRKIVIGFAFMVPDVKYNEAYISFIFTHPEWRRAGIAKFMLYHLIQTCLGKDVTLHVSATNPAMLLYQKFGFKAEEFILDFYDKYFPVNSAECKHAFFLRLTR